MKVYFIGTGPGDVELITIKALKILKQAPVVIYAGSLINPSILEYAPTYALRHDSSKLNLDEMGELYRKYHGLDKDIARLQSGDPCIYGAIGEQIDWLEKHGIDYEIIPGVSSFCAAAASIRRELTSPELTQSIILTRGSGRTPVPETEDITKLASHRATMVIFLSVQQLPQIVDKLKAGGYANSTPVAVINRASWPNEHIIRGDLTDIVPKVEQAGITKTALIMVGEALSGKYKPSRLYASDFTHQYRRT